jgi:hypothetical protein
MTKPKDEVETKVTESPPVVDIVKTVKIDLVFPVEHDGREYEQLQLRRMRVGDTLIAENETNQAKSGYMLFAALAGVDLEVIMKLDMLDLMKISEGLETLMGKQLLSKVKPGMANSLSGET